MAIAKRLDLKADRHTDALFVLRFDGYDLSGADFKAQVRTKPDAPGDPLLDLLKVEDDAEGIKVMTVATVGDLTFSIIRIKVTKAHMVALPAAPRLGDPALLAWDMQVTLAGASAAVWLYGTYEVEAGVVQ